MHSSPPSNLTQRRYDHNFRAGRTIALDLTVSLCDTHPDTTDVARADIMKYLTGPHLLYIYAGIIYLHQENGPLKTTNTMYTVRRITPTKPRDASVCGTDGNIQTTISTKCYIYMFILITWVFPSCAAMRLTFVVWSECLKIV